MRNPLFTDLRIPNSTLSVNTLNKRRKNPILGGNSLLPAVRATRSRNTRSSGSHRRHVADEPFMDVRNSTEVRNFFEVLS
jgi:hypothetical protein